MMFNIKLICVFFSVIFVVHASDKLRKATDLEENAPVMDKYLTDNNYNNAMESTVNFDKTDYQAKNYDEIDPIMDMLLNNDYENPVEPTTIDHTSHEEGEMEPIILYPDGVWKCGNCTNMKQMKLLHSETYDQDTNYDEYAEELNMEIQIGFSLKNMRCITIEAEDDIDVRLVSGACASEQATLGLMRVAHCVISVYG